MKQRAKALERVVLGLGLVAGSAFAADEPRKTAKNPNDLASYDVLVTEDDRTHWAFQPVRVPPVPEVKNRAWVKNPIDRFVLAGLEAKGWTPAPPANPRAILRRMSLDVTGLPPTPDEQEAFQRTSQSNPVAIELLADELLARPSHGERWARHWLDVVRFAESNGYERDAAKPSAWRYRDYVIRSMNADKPFDRFATEQLAGDELADGVNAETLTATGYFRLGPWDDEPADPKQDRFDQLDDLVVTTSEVFLGLTVGCARCHDHKFEPITQRDYYRLSAVFAPLRRPRNGRTEVDVPIGTPVEVAAEARRDARLAPLGRALEKAKTARHSFGRGFRIAALTREMGAIRTATPDLPRGYILREPTAPTTTTHLLIRGQAAAPGPRVEPGVPEVLAKVQPEFPTTTAEGSTSHRRLTLARWLTKSDNPLTARVIVNRVWQGHFGVGLVRTSSDFGTMGEPPTHPELIDWLAAWFVDHGWSLKQLHRLILSSATYQMSVQNEPRYAAEDPEDLLLWRRPYRRLEVEPIRDAMLSASGRLDRAMYGPSMYPFIPREAVEASSDPDTIWPAFDESAADRRTIYAFLKRSLVVPMLDLLDLCDTTRSTARRNVTSVPTQALTLLNGDFANRQARHLADRLEREADDDLARIDRAFALTLCRPPTEAERRTGLEFLKREAPDGSASARREALTQFCRAVFNTNEFVYPD